MPPFRRGMYIFVIGPGVGSAFYFRNTNRYGNSRLIEALFFAYATEWHRVFPISPNGKAPRLPKPEPGDPELKLADWQDPEKGGFHSAVDDADWVRSSQESRSGTGSYTSQRGRRAAPGSSVWWRRVAAGLRCSRRVADTDAGNRRSGRNRGAAARRRRVLRVASRHSCALASWRAAQYLRIRSATVLRCSSLIARLRLPTALAAFFLPRPAAGGTSPSIASIARCMATSWLRSERSSLRNTSRIPLRRLVYGPARRRGNRPPPCVRRRASRAIRPAAPARWRRSPRSGVACRAR